MRKQSINTFSKGLNSDLNPLNTPNDTYISAKNATLINVDGNEFIMQNDKGNQLSGSVKDGFIALGAKSYNGVAYIVSYNPTSAQGEIGSFPSPEYDNTSENVNQNQEGDMIQEYRPLNNFTGAEINIPENATEFTTNLFNFDVNHPLEIELQPSYDGTVNVIFTDRVNPVRIINSRFRVLSNNRFEIIDRVGNTDVNIYSNSNFEQTALILNSNQIIDLQFDGVSSGGSLPSGGYKYYFQYVNQDGNTTDIIEESSFVSVFFGNRPSDIRGGQPNEKTDKQVSFTLNNVDIAFNAVRVYFSYYASGKDEQVVPIVSQIDNDFLINSNTSIQINHTGFEDTRLSSSDEISLRFSAIDTVKSITQIQGRLLFGNVKSKTFDFDFFLDFSRKIKLASGEIRKTYNSLPSDSENIFNYPVNSELNNGYWNSNNIYHYLGYWNEEYYGFGIVYILKDGSTTDVFPIQGTLTEDYTGSIDESNDFFNDTTGRNYRGVYRFSVDRSDSVQSSLEFGVDNIQFDFSELTESELNKVQSQSIGFILVRTDRYENVKTEGILSIPARHTTSNGSDDLNRANETEDFVNVAPMPFFHMENTFEGDGGDATVPRFYYYVGNTLISDVEARKNERFDFSRMCLHIPELSTREVELQNNLSGQMFFKGGRSMRFKASNLYTSTPDGVYMPTFYGSISGTKYADLPGVLTNNIISANSFYISRGQTTALNTFTGEFRGTDTSNATDDRFRMYFEPYFGIEEEEVEEFLPFNDIIFSNTFDYVTSVVASVGNAPVSDVNETIINIAEVDTFQGIEAIGNMITTRLYNSQDPYLISTIKARTQGINAKNYSPVNKRTAWADVIEDNAIANITCYRGDCFKNLAFIRMFYGLPSPNDPLDNSIGGTNSDIGLDGSDVARQLGYLICFPVSSKTNLYLKDEFTSDVNETALYGGQERFFFPYSFRNEDDISNAIEEKLIGGRITSIRSGKFKLPESAYYNGGYNNLSSSLVQVPVILTSPFRENIFDNRIYYSEIYVNNNFENGYRNVSGLSFADYSRHLGEITKIVNVNNSLIMVQENGVAAIGVNDRTLVGSDTSGGVFVDQAGVLHPRPYYLSETYGSRWQFSIVASNNFLYGVDVDKDKIWRVEGNQLKLISDFSIQQMLRDKLPTYKNNEIDLTNLDVVSHFNSLKYDVIFTFYDRTRPELSFSVVYNELYSKWITEASYLPYKSFSIFDEFYSFNSQDNTNSFWLHNSDNVARCNYYGQQNTFELEFVILENAGFQKIYDNLRIISNNQVPIQVVYNTDNDINITQDIITRAEGNILSFNAEYKENHVYIEIMRNQNKRIRDKYARIRLIYRGEEHTVIQSIVNFFRYSYA